MYLRRVLVREVLEKACGNELRIRGDILSRPLVVDLETSAGLGRNRRLIVEVRDLCLCLAGWSRYVSRDLVVSIDDYGDQDYDDHFPNDD